MKKILMAALVILAACVLTLSVTLAGLYKLGWDNKFTDFLIKLIPFPVAVVDGKIVRLSDFRKLQQAHFLRTAIAGTPGVKKADDEIKTSLVENTMLRIMAEEEGITVTDAEANDHLKYISYESGYLDPDKVDQKVRDLFGWSMEEFKNLLVRPELLEHKLRINFLSRQNTGNTSEKISAAKAALDMGVSFEQTAQNFSEDAESKYIGGNLGIRPIEHFPFWFAAVAVDLEPGQNSQIISSADGFHIVRLNSIVEQKGVKYYNLSHILVRDSTFEKYFEQRKKSFKVIVMKTVK